MFSSFGNSGEGISFDDFFGFSEETSSTPSTLNVVAEQQPKQSQQSTATTATKKNEKPAALAQQPPLKTITPQIAPASIPRKQPLSIQKKEVISSSSEEESEEESEDDDEEEMHEQVQSSDSDNDEEMEDKESSSSSSSDSEDSEDSDDITIRKSIGKPVLNKEVVQKSPTKTIINLETPPKQSIIQQVFNKTSTSSAAVVLEKTKQKKLSPLKEKRREIISDTPKRKFIQTKLDKSMFERRVEQPSMDSSLFCMCCNTFIALSSTSCQNSAKRTKNASRYEEWDSHVRSEEHLLRKERLQRLNVLCFMNSPSNKRFHHFVNSFCLMFFHRLETLAVEFSKKNRKRKFEICEECEDFILLDYVINFIYVRVANLQFTNDFPKVLKGFLNNIRQSSLKIATTIWEQYKNFYAKMSEEDFGHLLSDIVHRAWDCMRHLAYFGRIQDPAQLFIDEPLEFEKFMTGKKESTDEGDSSCSEDEEAEYDEDQDENDIFNAQHPYFETFMKMYIEQFLFLKPIGEIINEGLEVYKSILEEETYFSEWNGEILKKKNQLFSQEQKSSNEDAMDDESSDESPTIIPPKPQAPKQKSIEDLLFGSAANNTFESFFSVTPKKPTTTTSTNQSKKVSSVSLQEENETMEEEDMWNLLRNDNI